MIGEKLFLFVAEVDASPEIRWSSIKYADDYSDLDCSSLVDKFREVGARGFLVRANDIDHATRRVERTNRTPDQMTTFYML